MTRFAPDPAGIEALSRSGDVQAAMFDVAEAGAVYAASIAPVRTGAYRDSLHAARGDDGEAFITSDDPGAVVIERGDGRTREGFHVLARTADWIESSS